MLTQLLPTAVSDILDTRNFHLVKALAKLEALFEGVLLAEDMPMMLSSSLLQSLDDQFMLYDFTVRSFQHSLKVGLRLTAIQQPSACTSSTEVFGGEKSTHY